MGEDESRATRLAVLRKRLVHLKVLDLLGRRLDDSWRAFHDNWVHINHLLRSGMIKARWRRRDTAFASVRVKQFAQGEPEAHAA